MKYRFLKEGEVLTPEDEFNGGCLWFKTCRPGNAVNKAESDLDTYRRPLPEIQSLGDEQPK